LTWTGSSENLIDYLLRNAKTSTVRGIAALVVLWVPVDQLELAQIHDGLYAVRQRWC